MAQTTPTHASGFQLFIVAMTGHASGFQLFIVAMTGHVTVETLLS